MAEDYSDHNSAEAASVGRDSPEVFISYSHDSPEHIMEILELSGRLRKEGVDCHIDQYEVSPSQGWPKWMKERIESARYVLVVCTQEYNVRFEGQRETSKGTTWEGAIITQEIYDAQGQNDKFIPVTLTNQDVAHIPTVLKPVTRYDLSSGEGYENLYRHLLNNSLISVCAGRGGGVESFRILLLAGIPVSSS